MATSTIRALVVDDSALYRKFVTSVLSEIPDVEVIGTAPNGRIGFEKIRSLKPDLITLDIEMPELDGLGLLRELSAAGIELPTIMISSLTADGASATNTALQLGAFDFVLKPVGKGPEESREQLKRDLAPKIKASLASLHGKKRKTAGLASEARSQSSVEEVIRQMAKRAGKPRSKPEVVGIGVSTGGPVALNQVIPKLPANFPCPILLVQHMPPMFTKSLAEDLNRKSAIEVLEAEAGMVPTAGQVLIAPGGSQMRVVKMNDRPIIQITDDPPEQNCRPAVDYLFRSIAHAYDDRAVGAIFTGMGDDGTLGCKLMKRAGAMIITQDEATCVVYGMPRSVFEAGISDQVVSLENLAGSLVAATKRTTGQGAIA